MKPFTVYVSFCCFQTSLFGAPATTASTGLFGAQSGFGQTQTGTGLFGQTGFGQTQQQVSQTNV